MKNADRDWLKYVIATTVDRMELIIDMVGQEDPETAQDVAEGHLVGLRKIAAQLGLERVYSDGRSIQTQVRNSETGITFERVWIPDVALDQRTSHTGALLRGDEYSACPGVYEVTYDPVDQSTNVKVVRTDDP